MMTWGPFLPTAKLGVIRGFDDEKRFPSACQPAALAAPLNLWVVVHEQRAYERR